MATDSITAVVAAAAAAPMATPATDFIASAAPPIIPRLAIAVSLNAA
jgi:hypothetical protein